ncbi:MAG: amidase family protein, partial [Janthinobacterium lividum]
RSDGDPHGTPLPAFTVDPAAGLRDALPGAAPAPRLALLRTDRWDSVEAPQRDALDHAAARLRASGAAVHEITLPPEFAGMWDWAQVLLSVEAAAIHRDRLARVPERLSDTLRALAAIGPTLPATDYLDALQQQRALRHRLSEVLAGFDAVLTVPATGTAPRGLDLTGDASLCAPWTYLGVPAVTLPVAIAANGLPLGIQLVGRYREDLHLLRTAAWAEAALAA